MSRTSSRGAHRAPGRAVIDYRGLTRPVGRTVGGVAVIGAVATGTALHDGQAARALTPSTGAHSANAALSKGSTARATSVVADVTLRAGARGEAVRQLQNALNARGASINVDGIFGPATNRAVRSFQSSQGLAVDGIVGVRTRAALNGGTQASAPAPSTSTSQPKLRWGSRGDAVRTLQAKLNERGASIAVDGIFGRGTDGAVRNLQRAAGIGVDGIVGPKTWNALGSGTSVSSPAPSNGGSESSTAPASGQPVLRWGSRGDAVRTLQAKLNERGASIAVDGIFGRGTDGAVRSLQRAAGIRVDGIAGRDTWNAANSSVRIGDGSGSRDSDRTTPPATGGGDGSTAPVTSTFNGQAIIAAARSQIGKSYVWGSSDPSRGFDCSGLVHYAYNQAGIPVSRQTAKGYTFSGRIISRSEAQPGDLVSFTANNYGHIGIYVGNGQIIDASGSARQVVERGIWNAPHVFVTFR